MQLHGHVVTVDGEVGGIVKSVGTATVEQPDIVEEDLDTGEEVNRTPQAPVEAASVEVAWEDGSTSTLVEGKDTWTVLGSVAHFDPNTDPKGESADNQAKVKKAVSNVKAYMDEMRAAAPYAEAARPARRTAIRLDA